MGGYGIAGNSGQTGWVRTLAPWLAAFALALAPKPAAADCEVTESGIPEDVVAPIDVGQVRKSLAKSGFALGGLYLGETFGNTGGIRQGVTYDGVVWMYLNGDLHKAGLWKGLCFHADAYQIHGHGITAENIGGLMPVSNYEALASTRLSELWLEQYLFDDRLAVRVGQLTADTEFLLSDGGGLLLNGTFGWAALPASDLPGGGPAYPLSTPGVRVKASPNDKLDLMVGIYNGDPANPNCTKDPQICNSDGLDFRLDDPPLLMIEGSYKYNQDGRLPGTLKLGGWNHFGKFEHQRIDSGGVPIAISFNSGRPIDGDWALYAIVDQLVWRMPGSEDPKGIGIFGRVIGAPSAQNLVDFYADGGLTFTGMIPRRPNDTLGLGFAYAGISNQVHGFDRDAGLPVARTYEALLEICYTYEIRSGWTLQPDFQYIWQPGGGVPKESGEGRVENAAVWGARTTLNF
jgi:porin